MADDEDDVSTYCDVGKEQDPFESIPAHARLGAPTSFAAEPTTVDTIVVLVSLARHACFAAPEGLTAAATLGDHGIDAFVFAPPAHAGGHEGGGELGGEVVDAEGDGAAGVIAQQGGAVRGGKGMLGTSRRRSERNVGRVKGSHV